MAMIDLQVDERPGVRNEWEWAGLPSGILSEVLDDGESCARVEHFGSGVFCVRHVIGPDETIVDLHPPLVHREITHDEAAALIEALAN